MTWFNPPRNLAIARINCFCLLFSITLQLLRCCYLLAKYIRYCLSKSFVSSKQIPTDLAVPLRRSHQAIRLVFASLQDAFLPGLV